MTYNLKWAEETIWAAVMAGLTYMVGVAAAGMPKDSWHIWAVTAAAGLGRVVFATVIAQLSKAPTTQPVAKTANVSYSTEPAAAAPTTTVSTPTAAPVSAPAPLPAGWAAVAAPSAPEAEPVIGAPV